MEDAVDLLTAEDLATQPAELLLTAIFSWALPSTSPALPPQQSDQEERQDECDEGAEDHVVRIPAPHRVYKVDTGSSKVQDAKQQRPGHDDQQAGHDNHGRRGSPDRLAQVLRTPHLRLRDLPNGAPRPSDLR